jgi:ligand-binding sensor domain-containing protein/serine phosphatase RsbU (regulator of sigma subunit)
MKRINYYIILIWLLTASSATLAQTPFLKPHHLFRGKEEYNVNVIYQDPKGWIWFGTDKGLFRFDGINYSRFTISEGLAQDQITALYSNIDEKLWIGHKNGEITLFDGHAFQIFAPEEGLGKIEITDITSDSSGVIWYSTLGEGVFRYDGRYLTNLNTDDGISDNYVYDIEIDNKGILWFATDNGITRYSGGKCDIISMKNGLNDNIVKVLKTSKDGRLWIGTEEKGLSIYDPVNKAFSSIEGWTFGPVTGFTMSLEDDIWISTEKEGIVQLKLNLNAKPSYRKITSNQGLISNRISTIVKDQEENIWIGGKQGVIQALPPVFEFLNKTNGTPFEMIYSLTKDNLENIWVCSESGLYRGIPDNTGQYEWSNLSEKMKLPKDNFISIFLDSEGQVWAGTYGDGVFRINPENLKYVKFTVSQGLSDNNVISISGSDNLVWFSTLGGGISCYNIAQSRLSNYHDTELRDSYVYATKSDKEGRTWIAGSLKHPAYIYHDSLYVLDKNGQRFPQLYGVALDSSDGLWFNLSDKGIIRVTADSISILGKKDGIMFDQIQSIIFDKLNNLLVISNRGLLFYKPKTGVILEFGENSGLSYQYPVLNSVFPDKQGQIWIGTETGIIKYNPEYLQFIDQNPRVFLSVKNLFYNPIKAGKKKFRHNENNFTFGYTGIWFSNPEGLSYRYMLTGYDLKWNYTNRNQDRTYSKLPAGEYTFKVEVSLDEKNWYSSADSSFSFRVHPPFWKRWWFIAGMTILVISSIYLYIKQRVSNLEKAKEELEEEVHKRTEEIRKQNEVLEEQKEELETQKEEISSQRDIAEEQRDKIEAQKEDIQASIRYAHRIQTAVLPPKNQLDNILKDYFILNKPRDIVSGDFFWVAQSSSHVFFSVGDCTGHGVPGSFMSMLGLSALNDIVKSLQICKASTILNLLRDRIQESLHQVGDREKVSNDGMDISLCILEAHTNKLQFAGAHNPLYIIQSGEIREIRADKMDIGSYLVEKQEFTNHELQCEEGDQLYLFSDGYSDQFGGPNGKKYKYQKFREFLVSIHNEPMIRQKWLLDEEIETWKGNFRQVDDILVMGIKIAGVNPSEDLVS